MLCVLAGALLIGGISLSCFPAPRFSAKENRYLAAFPQAELSAVCDGSYTAAIDAYATERFPARNRLRQLGAVYQLALGQRELGGVLLCRDGSLLRRITPNERSFSKNLSALCHWHQVYGEKLTVAAVPAAVMLRQAALPLFYDRSQDLGILQAIRCACPDALLFSELDGDADWYRTDHHWTTAGAYRAYQALGSALGYTPLPENAFTKEVASQSFYGTAHAATGSPFTRPDVITLYRFPQESDLSVRIDGKDAPFAGLYDFEKLQTQDGYGVFLGGNHAEMTITATASRPALLVIKDSFANALLPFLALHFDLTVVDPRYTKEELASYCSHAERILFLCGVQTLCETPFI